MELSAPTPAVRLEVLRKLLGTAPEPEIERRKHRLSSDRASGRTAPREGHCRQPCVLGREQLGRVLLDGPAPSERAPSLDMHVAKAIDPQTFGCPFGGVLELRRTGQPWTMDVGQVAKVFHHLRSRERLTFDPIHNAEVDRLLRTDDE